MWKKSISLTLSLVLILSLFLCASQTKNIDVRIELSQRQSTNYTYDDNIKLISYFKNNKKEYFLYKKENIAIAQKIVLQEGYLKYHNLYILIEAKGYVSLNTKLNYDYPLFLDNNYYSQTYQINECIQLVSENTYFANLNQHSVEWDTKMNFCDNTHIILYCFSFFTSMSDKIVEENLNNLTSNYHLFVNGLI